MQQASQQEKALVQKDFTFQRQNGGSGKGKRQLLKKLKGLWICQLCWLPVAACSSCLRAKQSLCKFCQMMDSCRQKIEITMIIIRILDSTDLSSYKCEWLFLFLPCDLLMTRRGVSIPPLTSSSMGRLQLTPDPHWNRGERKWMDYNDRSLLKIKLSRSIPTQ